MAWVVEVFGKHTGQPLGRLPVSSFQCAVSLNQGEGGTIDVSTGHPDWEGTDWDTLLLPLRRVVVVSWDDDTLDHPLPQFAGIVERWRKGYGAGVRTYTLRDVWSDIEARHVVDPHLVDPAAEVVSFGPAALSTLAGRVVEHVYDSPVSVDQAPISYPPYVAGPTTLTYRGFNASNAADALTDIISWSGGPDVWFRPLIDVSTGEFSWDMMAEPELYAGTLWEVNLDSEDGVEFSREVDASNVVTTALVFGEGAGAKTPVGVARVDPQVYPRRDIVSKDHATRRVEPLEDHAEKLVAWNSAPSDTYTLEVPQSFMAHLRPGMTLKINGASDPDFPSEQSFRVAGYSFSHSGPVTVDLF